jgi:RimJ/RimL family protein N-acetyltransferase
MTLRPATLLDAQRLYDWRRDPVTEEMSLTSGPESFLEHEQWLRRVLADPATLVFIAEDQGKPVGTGRLTVDGRKGDLGLTVNPKCRGQRYSPQIVAALMDEAKRRGIRRLTARVRNRNLASLKAFLGNEFLPLIDVVRLERNV